MNKKLLLIIGLVVLVVAIPLVRARLSGGAVVEVQVERLAPRSIQSSVLASGKLVHEEEVKLTTEEIGRVTAIFVERFCIEPARFPVRRSWNRYIDEGARQGKARDL